ncbi:high frequency lysogenization protein HflD [Pseudoxanthomonas spadix]|uniref:High frequency lysogenization protein HflD homolog n=1 Tax=Pseudoxanthomonas spadix (strain BD-a59) TaxID=1045855 RepID=G7UWN3_PSEUP|nr:high frequency lysogenization protein HflD [Pseudoxanthomonas spadix]AER56540.1 putative lysogenization regulator [Pseudoxanthomonas spadix BD-a59]MBP3975058.1 high frequency lysogenization protein HflD [Pseudoxanthomonas spadix]
MSAPLPERVLALAALAQALAQVRRIAETGQSDNSAAGTVLDSVFRMDAATTEAVYGRAANLGPGLRLVRDYFGGENKDPSLPRLAMAVLQVERRFIRETDTVKAVSGGLEAIAPQASERGSTHPDVLMALGTLYADTISRLRPRVMVQGNPHYLAQPGVVSEIRAILLAAVRAAVLWRQLGGSLWDFVFSRKAMVQAARGWLGA